MASIRVAALTETTGAPLAEAAVVFDQYRRHYGEPVVPGQAAAWLASCIRQRRLALSPLTWARTSRAWLPLSSCRRPCG